MSFIFSNQSLPAFFDQDLQVTSKIKGISFFVKSVSPAALGANASNDTNVALNGVRLGVAASAIPGDVCLAWSIGANQPAAVVGPICTVTAANQVTLRFGNVGAGTPTPTSANYAFMVFHVAQPTGLDS